VNRRVRRAPTPRTVPTLGQIAAALAASASSVPATALAKDAGAPRSAERADPSCAPDVSALVDAGKLTEAVKALDTCVTSCARMQKKCAADRDAIVAKLAVLVIAAPPGYVADAGVAGDAGVSAGDGGAALVDGEGRAPIIARVDGVERAFGVPISVDPGRHQVTFVYRNGEHVDQLVMIREGDKIDIAPLYCPFHPDMPLGGAPPPPSHHGGCCGAHETLGFDPRSLAVTALAVVVAARRRERRPSKTKRE
jgi:hypothetical protein